MEINRVFVHGDCHTEFEWLEYFCEDNQTTKDDLMIILGDSGINYWNSTRDYVLKEKLLKLPITLLCVHGNHEERPYNIFSYQEKEMFEGIVYVEEDFPNILFAKDGENYKIKDHRYLILGGAYSIDKQYRIIYGHRWYESEQPSQEIKNYVAKQLTKYNYEFDIVLSHTAPLKFEPVEMFLPGVDQSKVDKSTEEWLDDIENMIEYNKWYFGHYHGDSVRTNKVTMLFIKTELVK
ncbi:MAG: metallophosphoesterase [Erysipelotrichaceae bacterium]|nr:metallophosphoesterase [Erysipelotrichaceae bacterium]